MALVVDKTIKFLNVPDSNNFTIQCSKPMSQLSVDDVKSADFWVGFTSFAQNQMCEGNVESGLPQNDPNHCWCWATDNSALYDGDWSTAHWSFPANYPTGIYMRNILVECASAHTQNVSLQNDASARIVLNIEAGEDTKLQDLFIDSSSYICNGYNNENRVTDYRYIKPAVLMIVNDVLYIWIQGVMPYYAGYFCDSTTSQGYRSSQSYDDFAKLANHYLGLGWTRALESGDMYADSGSTAGQVNYTVNDVDFNGITADLNVSLGAANYRKRASIGITDNADKEIEKWYTAFTGFKFRVDGVWYKPIVQGGIVTGYTDDMTVMSEWDEWDNVSGHDVPVTPPVPPPPEEDPRDASIYGTYSGGAGVFARCWYCNQNALNSLWIWAGGSADPDDPQPPEGFAPIDSIIGLQMFPINIPHGNAKTAIVFYNAVAEGDRTVNTHVQNDVYLGDGKTFEIDLGSVTVDEHHANDWAYLDYDETVELYIPFCGVYNIDTQTVMGRTITAKLYVDPVAGTCTFIATCDNVDVAMGSGSMAVSLPVTANQYSMTLAAINNNRAAARNAAISAVVTAAAQVGSSFVSGYSKGYKGAERQMLSVAGGYDGLADSFGPGNAVRIARANGMRSGLGSAFTSLSNSFTAANIGNQINSVLNTRRANKMLSSSNNTAVSGSFGGSQDTWRLPMQAYIKTIRYLTKIPNNHVDAIGKIFLQETTLADCSGYTTVANPNLSSLTGFLTTEELTELYGILLNGIYAGGGAE